MIKLIRMLLNWSTALIHSLNKPVKHFRWKHRMQNTKHTYTYQINLNRFIAKKTVVLCLLLTLLKVIGNYGIVVAVEQSDELLELSQPSIVKENGATHWTITDCFKEKELDLIFLLGSSHIVDQNSTTHPLRIFLSNVVKKLQVTNETKKVGIFTFHQQVTEQLVLTQCNNNDCVFRAINSFDLDVGNRLWLKRALRLIKQRFYGNRQSLLKRWRRPFVLVIIIDGRTVYIPGNVIRFLRKNGARVIAIGYNNARVSDLNVIASYPPQTNVFLLDDNTSLLWDASNVVTSLFCEEVNNHVSFTGRNRNFFENKKSNNGNQEQENNGTLLELTAVQSTSSSISYAWKPLIPAPLTYMIDHVPRHGYALWMGNTATLYGLNPATSYKLTLQPIYATTRGRKTTFVYDTAPVLMLGFSVSILSTNSCLLQEKLEDIYDVQSGSKLSLTDCFSTPMTVIDVNWKSNFSNIKSHEAYTIPILPNLINIPKTVSRRVFAEAKPGANYSIIIRKNTLRIYHSEVFQTFIVAPPLVPANLSFKRTSNSSILISWNAPEEGEYDSFYIEILFANGRSFRIFEAPTDDLLQTNVETRNTRSFNHTITNIYSEIEYRINIYSRSNGVISSEFSSLHIRPEIPIGNHFSSRIVCRTRPQKFNTCNKKANPNRSHSTLLSAADGVYALDIASVEERSDDTSQRRRESLVAKKILAVPTGVVNAAFSLHFHNRTSDNILQWLETIVWIDRKTGNIKASIIGETIRTTTLVNGLFQPVGLAVDFYDDNVYWSDIGSKAIGVAKLKYCEKCEDRVNRRLISGDGMQNPISVTIDPIKRKLFWADLIGRIERSNMDGQNRMVIVNDTFDVYSLVYCVSCERLYWMNSLTKQVESVRDDGTDRMIISSVSESSTGIFFIANFESRLFFLDSENLLFGEFVKDRTDLQILTEIVNPEVSLNNVAAISIFDRSTYEMNILRQPERVTFPCSNDNKCKELCISTTLSQSICTGQCYSWEILCSYRSSACVNSLLTCDGTYDCPNGEDEFLPECNRTQLQLEKKLSKANSFKCASNEKYISNALVCDGRIDCRDSSDEEACPIQEQTCDFEEDICLWIQSSNDDFDWIRWHGRTPSNFTGPALDHTLLRTNSSYVYIEATNHDPGATAVLKSTLLAKPICVGFYYHMFGAHVGSLTLQYRSLSNNLTVELWRKSGNQGSFWNHAQVSVNQHGLYQILFEAVRGLSYRSDIAIDDVTIADGLCKVNNFCSFQTQDDLLCGFEKSTSDSIDWMLWSEPRPALGTEQSQNRKFVSTHVKPPTTRPLDLLGKEWFYFNFTFENNEGCNECNGIKLVRELFSYGSPRFAGIIVCENDKYKIFLSDGLHEVFLNVADTGGNGHDHCEFIGGKNFASEVGNYSLCQGNIGYTRNTWGEPLQKSRYGAVWKIYSPSYYRCDVIIPQDVIDNDPVKRMQGQPNIYLYFNANEAGINGTAKFTIPVSMTTKKMQQSATDKDLSTLSADVNTTFNPLFTTNVSAITAVSSNNNVDSSPSYWCLLFRYRMSGSDVGSLGISVNNEYIVWFKEGQQVMEWNRAVVNIPVPIIKYDLVFVAGNREELVGDIAVDDITIKEEACSISQVYKCTFEKRIEHECAFVTTSDQLIYLPVNKLYEKELFDPNIIYTDEEPTMLLTSSINAESHEKSDLETQPLNPVTLFYPRYCFIIEYRQKADEGDLTVYLRNVESKQREAVSVHNLPKRSNIRPWLFMRTEIDSSILLASRGSFVVEFKGLSSIWTNSISVNPGACSSEGENLCNNAVLCSNNACVESQHLCDGFNDCGDWSDEIGCPSYCGNVADMFAEHNVLVNTSLQHTPNNHQCVWRIHGNVEKYILIDIGENVGHSNEDRFTLEIYQGFPLKPATMGISSANFPNLSKVTTKRKFKNPSKHVIEASEATIILNFPKQSLVSDLSINASLVGKDHCKTKCSENFCVTDNFLCDGVVGCPDGSDESNCTRMNTLMGENVIEVRRLTSEFSIICGEDITSNIASYICQQEGFWKAEQPLRFIQIPDQYDGPPPYRLQINQTIEYPQYVQAHLAFNDESSQERALSKRKGEQVGCQSNTVWVASCVSYQCGTRTKAFFDSIRPSVRIAGGTKSRKGDWPWVVSIQLLGDDDHQCGGTLISDRHVLTAAHCFDHEPPENFFVLAGAVDLVPVDEEAKKYFIKNTLIHENYNPVEDIPDWDIALLELNAIVRFSPYTSAACLPGGDIRFRPGDHCHVVGYGRHTENGPDPNLLFHAITPILTHRECNRGWYDGSITPRMTCTGYPNIGGTGICHGDSGGPLFCQSEEGVWYLNGIVSWSIGCAEPRKPDVYTNVQYFIEWINLHTNSSVTIPDHVRPGTCGGTYFNESQGSIASPGWPSTYPTDIECLYRILAGPGQTVRLEIDSFATESEFDILSVFHRGVGNEGWVTDLSGWLNANRMIYEVYNGSMELLFHSDKLPPVDLGFYATWTVTGTPQNHTGQTYALSVTSVADTFTAQFPEIAQMMGAYFYSEEIFGHRPLYSQNEEDMATNEDHQLFFYPPLGQWRIIRKTNNRKYPLGVWLCVNDTSSTPNEITATWKLWSDNDWHSIDLHIIARPDLTVAMDTGRENQGRTKQQHGYNTGKFYPCKFSRSSLSGVVVSPGFPFHASLGSRGTCSWHINSSVKNSNINASNWILLLINFYHTDDQLNIYGGKYNSSKTALYSISGAAVLDQSFLHTYNLEQKVEENNSSAPRDMIAGNSIAIELNESVIQNIALQIATSPSCHQSFTRFSTDLCARQTYSIFTSVNAATTLLQCDLLIRCRYVSWCELNRLLNTLSDDSLTEQIVTYITVNRCDNPLWHFPYINDESHLGNTTAGKIRSSNVSDTAELSTLGNQQRILLVYEDTTREGVSLRLEEHDGLKNGEGFYINYEIVTDLDGSTYNDDRYNRIHIGQTLPRRLRRSMLQSSNPLSLVGHPSSLPMSLSKQLTNQVTASTSATSTPFQLSNVTHVTTTISRSTQNKANSTTNTPPSLVRPSFSNVFASCQGTVSTNNSVTWIVITPNFPEPYGFLLSCVWTFSTWPGYQVILEFIVLDLEEHVKCKFDAVTVYDGRNITADVLGVFCDKSNMFVPILKSTGSHMTLFFHSDHVESERGFQAIASAMPIPPEPDFDNNRVILFECTFIDGFCGFTNQLVSTAFTWTRHKGPTPSLNTGPPYDASTNKKGSYLFIETSIPRIPGEKARVISPQIIGRPDAPVCLRFSYDMYGATIGFLNVYLLISLRHNHTGVKLEEDSTESVASTEPLVYIYGSGVKFDDQKETNISITETQQFLLWTKSGEQRRSRDKPWKEAAVTFYPFNDFQLMFEGVTGRNYQSDLAIDEITVTEGECPIICDAKEGSYECINEETDASECIPSEFVCDGKEDCSSGSDESSCFSTIRSFCTSVGENAENHTMTSVCSPAVVDRCGVRSVNFTRIDDILCDGIFDCFGGFDEALCDDPLDKENEANQETIQMLRNECGVLQTELSSENVSDYPNISAPRNWPWVAGLYVAKRHLVTDTDNAEESMRDLIGYTFLCSAVFIRPTWIVVPAHCILNPDSYLSYSMSSSGTNMEEPDDEIGMAKHDSLSSTPSSVEEEEIPDMKFSYIVVTQSSAKAVANVRTARKVSRWLLHPGYQVNDPLMNVSASIDSSDVSSRESSAKLWTDAHRVAYDVALMKLELDDFILSTNEVPNKGFIETLPPLGEDNYVLYDEPLHNDFNHTVEQSVACLEVISNDDAKVASNKIKPSLKEMDSFILPPETTRFPLLSRREEDGLPDHATCYLVGHSPVAASSAENDNSQSLQWNLREYLVPVTSADITIHSLFCESYADLATRSACSQNLNKNAESVTANLQLSKVLIRSGYQNNRVASFVHDQGTMLFCRRYDNRWFLAGMFNWINLRRNLHTPDFASIVHDISSGGSSPGYISQNPTLGIPLGTDYLTKLTSSINGWIDKTLHNPCLGEFSCFSTDSSKSKCISLSKRCDGVIDCLDNYADEINCESGCAYNPFLDPFNQYYSRLSEVGVQLPSSVYIADHTSDYNTTKSWRNYTTEGLKTIRFNQIYGNDVRSCHWTILPPEGKVAVFRIPKMVSNPAFGETLTQIISGSEKVLNDWSEGPHFYTSKPNKPITFLLSPAPGSKHLKTIRNLHINYYVEETGSCTSQHKCGDGTCISPHKVCNGRIDCLDLSDEIDCPSGCNGRSLYVGATQGSLFSRNYPLPHTGNGDCMWIILATSNRNTIDQQREITLRFSDFITSTLDELYVYVGVGSTRRVHGVYSGNQSKFNVTIPANEVTLLLRSNDGIAKRRINGQFHISPPNHQN